LEQWERGKLAEDHQLPVRRTDPRCLRLQVPCIEGDASTQQRQ
jgi:hypothetical protein